VGSERSEAFKKTWIGVDIGGTKIAIGAVTCQQSAQIEMHKEIPSLPPDSTKLTNSSDKEDFINRLVNAVVEVALTATKKDFAVVPAVGVGCAGKIVEGVIAKGTTPQLGAILDDFDIRTAIQNEIRKHLPKFSVVVRNDALAQLYYGIHHFVKDPSLSSRIIGHRVGYIGPGTGLGGGFARVNRRRNEQGLDVEFLTDGHIGDIIFEEDGQRKLTEDHMLSGRYIYDRTGKPAFEISQRLNDYTSIVEELGRNLGKIIEALFNGQIRKARETTNWSKDDIKSVKGIKFYIIGGSIGTKGKMGEMIRLKAQEYLIASGLKDIDIKPLEVDPSKAAIIGAASFVGLPRV